MTLADPFARPVLDLARALVGATLLVDGVGGTVVETEAYARHDAASHSCRGPTARNRAMFGPPGRAYVYRSYGIHWCFNVVGGEEPGCAVLLRALHPTHGLDRMRARRGLDASHDGADLGRPPFALSFAEAVPDAEAPALLVGPRIGISKNPEAPWRFGLAGSRCLSRPFPRGRRDA